MMDLQELLLLFNRGDTLGEDFEVIQLMRFYSREAQKITMEINTQYHEPEELSALFSSLIMIAMVTPDVTVALAPIQTRLPIRIGAGCSCCRFSGSKSWFRVASTTPCPIRTPSPMKIPP